MRLVYLPPYSPDFNPIEEAFSAFKAWLRSNRDYVISQTEGPNVDPYDLFYDVAEAVMSPENARGWFHHSGYIEW